MLNGIKDAARQKEDLFINLLYANITILSHLKLKHWGAICYIHTYKCTYIHICISSYIYNIPIYVYLFLCYSALFTFNIFQYSYKVFATNLFFIQRLAMGFQ